MPFQNRNGSHNCALRSCEFDIRLKENYIFFYYLFQAKRIHIDGDSDSRDRVLFHVQQDHKLSVHLFTRARLFQV